MKPYYDDGSVVIYHGDCAEIMPTLKSVDLIFTSPPYNLGVNPGGSFGHWKDGDTHGGNPKTAKWLDPSAGMEYGAHGDAMPADDYMAWQRHVLGLCWARLTDCGAIFYNHKPRVQATTLWTPLKLNPGLPVRQIITWARAGGMCFTTTAYVPTSEWIVVFAKPDWRLKNKGASGLGDVWYVPQDTSNDHPAPFPIGLPGRAIESTAPRTVLDPFAGSGTTLRAAKDAGVKAVGIELSERYCEIAAERMSQEVLAV